MPELLPPMTREQSSNQAARNHLHLHRWHMKLARAHRECMKAGFPVNLLCLPIAQVIFAVFDLSQKEFHRAVELYRNA